MFRFLNERKIQMNDRNLGF